MIQTEEPGFNKVISPLGNCHRAWQSLARSSHSIFTHIVAAIVYAIKTGEEDPKIDDTEDERDKLIDLRGTRITYIVSSFGVFLSMLAFVLGQPPLVMFSLLIFFGIFAQVIGDISRLVLYRRGF